MESNRNPFPEGFSMIKRNAVKAAKDLGYGNKVIKKLKAAKSEREIDCIMATARKTLL